MQRINFALMMSNPDNLHLSLDDRCWLGVKITIVPSFIMSESFILTDVMSVAFDPGPISVFKVRSTVIGPFKIPLEGFPRMEIGTTFRMPCRGLIAREGGT